MIAGRLRMQSEQFEIKRKLAYRITSPLFAQLGLRINIIIPRRTSAG